MVLTVNTKTPNFQIQSIFCSRINGNFFETVFKPLRKTQHFLQLTVELCFLKVATSCTQEKFRQKISAQSLKLNYWSPKHQTGISKAWISFKCSQLLTTSRISNQFTQFERKWKKFTGGLNTKNFCSIHIMRELPTNKANFLFKNTQDFN